MNLRRRVLLSLLVTIFILGSAFLVWGSSTGRLSIFADQTNVLNADLAVTSPVDLAKGVSAGDQQVAASDTGIQLLPGARSGNAIFSVGERDVLTFHRVVPIVPSSLGSHSHITLQFAGSTDGVSYNDYSSPQLVTVDATTEKVDPISLDFLIPSESRFLRVKVILDRSDVTESPTFSGFTVNYDLPAPTANTGTSQELLVNGSPMNTDAGTAAPAPGQPSSLVVTGPDWWPFAFATLWFICMFIIFTVKPASKHDVEGTHGSRAKSGS